MLSLLGLAVITAQSPIPDSDWRVDDFVARESVRGLALSPDGKQLAWVKGEVDEKKQRNTRKLMLTEVESGETIQLTRPQWGANQPKWSPDGKFLTFLSSHKADEDSTAETEGTQLWRLDLRGGEPIQVGEVQRGINTYAFKDKGHVLYLSAEAKNAQELRTEKAKDTSIVTEDAENEPPIRLFELDLGTGKSRRLTENRDWIDEFKISPDNRWVYTSHTQSLREGWDQDKPAKHFLLDLKSGARREILNQPNLHPRMVAFSRDSKTLFVQNAYTTHPRYLLGSVGQLLTLAVEDPTAKPKQIDLDWERGIGAIYGATPRGVLLGLEDGVQPKMAHYVPSGTGWRREWICGQVAGVGTVSDIKMSEDGKTVILQGSNLSQTDQLYKASFGATTRSQPPEPVWGGLKALTDLNPQLKARTYAKTEIIRWKGALNEEVEGILYYPRGYVAGKQYPLILNIHGGPHGADVATWSEGGPYVPNWYAQRGAFSLFVNYHGSSSYGLKFSESIADGNYYKLPVEDLQKGVDHLIGKGMVDPRQLGTVGWSNGAILSAALIAEQPGRFKVAYLGAGGIEWTADWAICGFGRSFDEYYIGKSPIEDPERYREVSVLYKFDKVTTPSIIFCGTEDTAVPIHHSWMQFRTLQVAAKAPVRFLQFPGEGHGLDKPSHVRRCQVEGMDWVDRYLFGKEPTRSLAEEGSPLANLRTTASFAKNADGHYGVPNGGALLPEIVQRDKLKVGRFEITRAQFSAFSGKPIRDSEANLPVAGVTVAEAKAYCAWLSTRTGRTYRLPKSDEATSLYGRRGGNTLDYWFGFAVSPVDVEKLQRELAGLATEQLLRAVGSFGGDGEPEVYDLDGNAAEWLDSGEAAGGSVDTPRDPSGTPWVPQPRFIGFRVVEG